MKVFGTSSFAAIVFSGLIASCVDPPDPKGPGNQPPPPPAKVDDANLLPLDDDAAEVEEIRGITYGAPIPNSTVTNKTKSHVRPASFNLNRYKDGGRLNRATGKKIGATGATTHDQVLSYIAATNGWDIVALQEVLDEQDDKGKYVSDVGGDATSDVDFPKLRGYKVLPGRQIKTWYNGAIHEHCPIYYKEGGAIESCTEGEMVSLVNTSVHWAECTLKRSKKKFNFGCAHIAYGLVSAEVAVLGDDIKTRVDGGATSGQKFEFILGMDANSFHAAPARQSAAWDEFHTKIPGATFPTFPADSFTKVSKRDGKHGPPSNPENKIYDWLVFNVTDALEYVSPSLRVTPVSTQLKVPAGGGNVHVRFNEAWYESFSDHLPVDALFKLK